MVSERALSGIRVIEIADAYGEWCGKLLADMGADVIKIEPPSGSPTRAVGPFDGGDTSADGSLYFWHCNTSKRGIALDIEQPRGADLARGLIDSADVLLETLPPGRAAELGLNYATLSSRNPRLIHAAVTPFGQSGPYVDAGYRTTDLVTMALGGPMQSCGYDEADGDGLPPVRPGQFHSYHTASHYAHITIMVALMERETSGLGQFIDVSAQAALAVTVEFSSVYWEYEHVILRRQTGRHSSATQSARTQYICADGTPINLAIPLDERGWQRLLDLLRDEGLGDQIDELREPAKRLEHASLIFDALEVLTAQRTSEDLFHMGQRIGLTWGAVRAPEDWLDDPHARDRRFFVDVDHGDGRHVTYPGAPYKFSGTPWSIARRAPMLGEHTRDTLSEIGIADADVRQLIDEQVIVASKE